VALPSFAAVTPPLLLSAGQQSIDISCLSDVQQRNHSSGDPMMGSINQSIFIC